MMFWVGFLKFLDMLLDYDIGCLVDFVRIVVVVGFLELGLWGNVWLCWEMEIFG